MPDEPVPAPPAALQFERAEFDAPAPLACAACRTPLVDRYFEANGQVVCAACAGALERSLTTGSGAARFVRATVFGLGAAVAGAALWYAVREITHLEIGLIAIVVGMLVGTAVRKGSGGRGGRGYQVLAVVLTYVSIVSSSVPYLVTAYRESAARHQATATARADTPDAVADPAAGSARFAAIRAVVFVALVLASPFFGGFSDVIGWLIIFFGLQQAWRLNRRLQLTIAGPFPIVRAGASA